MTYTTYTEKYQLSWARLVSDICSPPIMGSLLVFMLALTETTQPGAIPNAALYGLLVFWVPVIFIAYMVKRGKITDIHMKLRRQRIWPFIISIACSAVAVACLSALHASVLMLWFAWSTLLSMLLLGLVTLYWQISIHAMSITTLVVVAGVVWGWPAALLASPLVILVGTARLNLRRHTLPQLIAGGLVGILVPLVLLYL